MKLELAKFNLKQRLNQRETMILLATLLVACLGYFKACILPIQKASADALYRIDALELEQSGLQSQIAAQKSQGEVRKAVPQKQWLGFVAAINQSVDVLARGVDAQGLKITGVEIADSNKKEDPFPKKSISLTVSGGFHTVQKYLKYLESLPAPLVVESISIAPNPERPSHVLVKLQGGFYVAK